MLIGVFYFELIIFFNIFKEEGKMSYVDEVLEIVKKKNGEQAEFIQAVTEVLESLRPVVDANKELQCLFSLNCVECCLEYR